MSLSATKVFFRGSTVQWVTTFYGASGEVVQPDDATVNIAYEDIDGEPAAALVAMAAPTGPAVTWTALWDSRGVSAPQQVYWSIHTGSFDPIPVAVEDGQFQLTANPANLVTF